MPGVQSYKDLEIWKKGIVLVKQIYDITKPFPEEEKYGLTSQMRRSAISVPSNIAEGFRRKGQREFKQFLNIALGSLAELETQLVIATEVGYLSEVKRKSIEETTGILARMILALSHKL